MIRRFGAATILVMLLTLGFWITRQYLEKHLVTYYYNAINSFFATLLVVLGVLAAYKDLMDLLHILSKSQVPKQITLSSISTIRHDLLLKVRTLWIDGLLHSTLPVEEAISVTAIRKSNLVISSPVMDLYDSLGNERIPVDALRNRIGSIFGGRFLILGNAGAGKTVVMLQLVNELLELAEGNANIPVPVIFNLSTWKEGERSFDEWLTNELFVNYNIDKEAGREILNKQDLHIFLDSFDQVAKERRGNCIESINNYIETHGQTRIVVISRTYEYEQTRKKFKLLAALEVEPLSDAEIERFLVNRQHIAAIIKFAEETNIWSSDFTKTPLHLMLISRTYQDVPLEEVNKETFAFDLNALYQNYVTRMLLDATRNSTYTIGKALHWLNWLAKFMRNEQLMASECSNGCAICDCCSGLFDSKIPYINPKKLNIFMLPRKDEKRLETQIIIVAGTIQAIVAGTMAGFIGVTSSLILSLPVFLHEYNSIFISPAFIGLLVGFIVGILGRVGNGTFGRLTFEENRSYIGLTLDLAQRLFAAVIGGLILGISQYTLQVPLTIGWSVLGSSLVTLLPIIVFLLNAGVDLLLSKSTKYLKLKKRISTLPVTPIKNTSSIIPNPLVQKIHITTSKFLWKISNSPLAKKQIETLLHSPMVRLYTIRKGYLPQKLEEFLDDMTSVRILRKSELGYEFIHDTLTDYFVNMNPEGLNKNA